MDNLCSILFLVYNSADVSCTMRFCRFLNAQCTHSNLSFFSFVSQVTHPTWLAAAFPDIEILQDPDNFFFRILAGFSSGYIYTLFFSILPQVFKLLAMSEGTSSSKVDAEEKALRFYWYFMLVTAFTGGYLVNLLIASLVEGNVSDEVRDILGNVAATMASEVRRNQYAIV